MVFVDGENLAIRYGSMLSRARERGAKPSELGERYRPGIGVWTNELCPNFNFNTPGTRVIRKYYYTSVVGDPDLLSNVEAWVKGLGFETPRVFKKIKSRGSKRVDISLATDMLSHAFRKHYDIAVLVAGDEDYVPLVQAVKSEGARVHVWFVSDGLSKHLHKEADYFVNLDPFFGM